MTMSRVTMTVLEMLCSNVNEARGKAGGREGSWYVDRHDGVRNGWEVWERSAAFVGCRIAKAQGMTSAECERFLTGALAVAREGE